MGVAADPAVVGRRGRLGEDRVLAALQVGVEDGEVRGLVEGEAQGAVVVAQLDGGGAAPAVPPRVECSTPLIRAGPTVR